MYIEFVTCLLPNLLWTQISLKPWHSIPCFYRHSKLKPYHKLRVTAVRSFSSFRVGLRCRIHPEIKAEADVNNDAGFEVGSGADHIKSYEEMTPTKLQRNIRLRHDSNYIQIQIINAVSHTKLTKLGNRNSCNLTSEHLSRPMSTTPGLSNTSQNYSV